MPDKRALLIGINAYPHVPPLSGCVNDVRLMHSVLVDTFGFPPDHITLLADEQATRAGILAAFDALVAATGPDDIVVIHYAGHGSQMADREGDEPSGFDSTIVPFDAARAARRRARHHRRRDPPAKLEALAAEDAVHDADLRRLPLRDDDARRLRRRGALGRTRPAAGLRAAAVADSRPIG